MRWLRVVRLTVELGRRGGEMPYRLTSTGRCAWCDVKTDEDALEVPAVEVRIIGLLYLTSDWTGSLRKWGGRDSRAERGEPVRAERLAWLHGVAGCCFGSVGYGGEGWRFIGS